MEKLAREDDSSPNNGSTEIRHSNDIDASRDHEGHPAEGGAAVTPRAHGMSQNKRKRAAEDLPAAGEAVVPSRPRGRPPGSKNKPKPANEDLPAEGEGTVVTPGPKASRQTSGFKE